MRARSALIALALVCAVLTSTDAQTAAPAPLPLPSAIHPLLARGRAAILESPGTLITVGRVGCRFPTLKAALEASPGGNARICLMDTVHRESGIVIRGNVEIFGFGAVGTVLEAAARPEEAGDRVIRVEEGACLYLSGLTVRGGRPSDRLRNGGGIANYGRLVIEDCAVIDNQSSAGAGIWSAGPLEIRRSVIAANRTVPRPAADATAAVGCQGSGAGIKVDKPGSARIEDTLIAWNASLKGGGGLHVACETEVRLSRCTIFGNSSKTRGGGIDLAGGTLILERCTVAGNVSTGKGFAVHNRGRLSLSGCLLAGEYGTAYYRAVDSGGEFGSGALVLNEGNYCQSGNLPGSAVGDPGPLVLADHGGPVWTVLPDPSSPARGYGAGPLP
ncbi:MAG TPA: right-handed parallel beta-helix repeat-containing protein [Spirochaetia bacterium]|nr:right-handed parallel beta-helix repeat-containing protein [Spirochaetales bacterium]HRY81042.1 right-handed parallel beta-helix repeat-containing protein [Spirochaetia bacterium]HRZ88788.1 right-handed parallel beta-helix repeat-containing protein [Spirochaetia bacterium]